MKDPAPQEKIMVHQLLAVQRTRLENLTLGLAHQHYRGRLGTLIKDPAPQEIMVHQLITVQRECNENFSLGLVRSLGRGRLGMLA